MVRPRGTSFAVLALALGLASCSQLPADGTTTDSPIFGGTADTTDNAVMALIHQMTASTSSACSGTTIATVGASGIFLTAGHCVVANDGMGHVTTPLKVAGPADVYIIPGPDWMTSVGQFQYYGVAQVAVHPQYDGAVDSPFDVALVRYQGALPSTPVIPALAPADDKLTTGSSITVVGFGKTQTDTMNSQRREVARVIQTIATNQFVYDQTDLKGACEGDSGGPALVTTPAGLRVAGVTSFGDPDCTMVGASVRVSPAAAFIQSFIDSVPKTVSCDDCTLASVGPGNACVDASAACGPQTSVCAQFAACAGGCQTGACVTQCRQSFPAGATAYDKVVNCQCDACAGPCSSSMGCIGHMPATGSAGAPGGTGAGGSGAGGTSVVVTGVGGSVGVAGSSAGGGAGAGGAGGTTAGVTAAAGGKSGCGCDLGSPSGPRSGVGALFALALVATRARRRHRR
jgi:secreted trypsin-like serine protease